MTTPATTVPFYPIIDQAFAEAPLGSIFPAAQAFISPQSGIEVEPEAVALMQDLVGQSDFQLAHDPATDLVKIARRGDEGAFTRREFAEGLRELLSERLMDLSYRSRARDMAAKEGLNRDGIHIADFVAAGLLTQDAVGAFQTALQKDTRWARFIKPLPRKELSGPRWRRDVQLSAEMISAAIVAGALECVGNTAISVVRLPRTLKKAYAATWKTPKIGPNLKVMTSALLPVGAVLTPPAMALGSVFWGLGSGAVRAIEYGASGSVRKAFGDMDTVWHGSMTGVDMLAEDLMKPPKKGFAFDIKVFEAGRGFVGALVSPVIAAPPLAIMGIPRGVQAYRKLMKDMWRSSNEGTILKMTYSLLLTVATPVAIALLPVAAALFMVGEGAVQGYKYGVGEAIRNAGKRVDELWTESGKLIAEDK